MLDQSFSNTHPNDARLQQGGAEEPDNGSHLGGKLLSTPPRAEKTTAPTRRPADNNPPLLTEFKGQPYEFAGIKGFQQGVPDSMRTGTSVDGGKVTYDAAGNVVSWTSQDGKLARQFQYKDVDQQRAALPFNPALPWHGPFKHDDKEVIMQRQPDGNGKMIPADQVHAHHVLDQTLEKVTDNQGHVWHRDQKNGLMQQFETDNNRGEKSTDQLVRDDELIPQTIPDPNNRLYVDQSNPLPSIRPGAIQQGNIGNCSFEATQGDMAGLRPTAIQSMIETNKDGTFTVKFPNSDDVRVEPPTAAELKAFNGPDGIHYVGVLDKGMPAGTINKTPGPQLGYWATVIEKARRYLSGNVSEDHGGYASTSMRLLTGVDDFQAYSKVKPEFHNFLKNLNVDPHSAWADFWHEKGLKNDSDLVARIEDGLDHGKLVVAGTPNASDEWVKTTDARTGIETTGHLLPAHAYSVMRYLPASASPSHQALFVVRNPWGDETPFKGSGYFTVTATDLPKLFNQFDVGG